jgi:NAD(P)-dependent dehydrogenase (short-subunit alcohol dehydrogenase family)
MQANHLSHFLLTSLVFDLLEAAASAHGEARVISHSSGARHSPDVVMRRDGFEKAWYDESPLAGDLKPMAKWARYQQSKRANLAFTYALADLIDRKGAGKVKAVCAHPGATNSGLQVTSPALPLSPAGAAPCRAIVAAHSMRRVVSA